VTRRPLPIGGGRAFLRAFPESRFVE
jgi:hypothetical protein